MKKNIKSITASSVWLTELTDVEMESPTGGAISSTDLDTWLQAYNNGTLQPLSVVAKLQRDYRTGDGITDAGVISVWFAQLSRDDKKVVISAVASSLVNFVKTYLHIT